MSDEYRIFGAEVSPYSVKVRSYFRYKGIAHEWIERSSSSMAEYQKYAKLPIIPAVATPRDEALQDSTPIIEEVEKRHPEPSIHPPGVALRFLSELIEEFGDEWGNKWMFHYRWAREADQKSASQRTVAAMMPDASEEERAKMADGISERMVGRGWVIGSNETTAPMIEKSFKRGMALLEEHLDARSYLFGERPAFGDFGLWGQVYNAWTDPTPGAILRADFPRTCAWVERMLDPKAGGEFETLASLQPTLSALLQKEVRLFLRWSAANAKAIASGAEELTVDLDGQAWTQSVGGPQKYHAKTLRELRRKFSECGGDAELREILEDTGCLEWLAE